MSAEAAPYEGGAATRLAADPAYRGIRVGDRVRVTFERAPETWPEHAARVGQTGEVTWRTPGISHYVVRFEDGDAMSFPSEQLEVLA